jgi:carboxypeptidase C (cathepsin A)
MLKSKTNPVFCGLVAVCFGLIFAVSIAAAKPPDDSTTEPSTQPSAESSLDKLSTTEHSLSLNGQTISYTATAGTISMKDESGKPKANFFFVSYVKKPGDDLDKRPITFVFNGGPGAAAVWLHLGAVGPQRIQLGADGLPTAPPYHLIDNDQSWLDLTDLVFIDPIGTGFSRPAEGEKASDFFGVEHDTSSVAEFIRLYLTRYERWSSPKFLAGESYGTTRAAALSDYLLENEGINLNGIILISSILNFANGNPSSGNDLPFALYLPSYTSIAVYHHKVQTNDPDKLQAEVEHWAANDYLTALAKGSALSAQDRADVIAHLASYTGLPADFIDKSDLRIDPWAFRKHLLNDQRLIIGRFDARITGEDTNPASDDVGNDPSESLYLPVYTATFNDYVRRQLKFESDLKYEVLSDKVFPWDFGNGGGGAGEGYLDVTNSLRTAMVGNPHLKIMVAAGHDDLATPYFAANYTFDHLDLSGKLRSNVKQTYYPSGHMIYHDPDSLKKLKSDVADFFAWATAQ